MAERKPISLNVWQSKARTPKGKAEHAEVIGHARAIEEYINARLGDEPQVFLYDNIARDLGIARDTVREILMYNRGSENSIRW